MEIKYAVKIIDKTERFVLDEAGSNTVKEEKKPRYNRYTALHAEELFPTA